MKNAQQNQQQIASGGAKKKVDSKDKLIVDMKAREDERQFREGEIMKDLAKLNTVYLQNRESQVGLEKQLKKMLRKCLMLTLDVVQGPVG